MNDSDYHHLKHKKLLMQDLPDVSSISAKAIFR